MEVLNKTEYTIEWTLFFIFLALIWYFFSRFIFEAIKAFFKKIHEENSKGFTGTRPLSDKEALDEYRKSLK